MTRKHYIFVLCGVVVTVVVALVICFVQNGDNSANVTLSDTEKCVQIHEMVCVLEPVEGEQIASPLTVRGEARGHWFFEASFPVVLTDWDGRIVAEGYAQAESEWMTSDFVPFIATIIFEKPAYGERGTLILKKDNPSGLLEHDDAAEFFVKFK